MSNCSCGGPGRVPVYCFSCGTKIAEVNPKVPGTQRIGCPNCGRTTEVVITNNGRVNSY